MFILFTGAFDFFGVPLGLGCFSPSLVSLSLSLLILFAGAFDFFLFAGAFDFFWVGLWVSWKVAVDDLV
jgi:hypothetical protein